MLKTSWINAILQLYSQVTDLFGFMFVKRITIRLFDLLALFLYILKLPRMPQSKILKDTVSKKICNVANVFPAFSWHDVILHAVHQSQCAMSRNEQRATMRNEFCTFKNTDSRQKCFKVIRFFN